VKSLLTNVTFRNFSKTFGDFAIRMMVTTTHLCLSVCPSLCVCLIRYDHCTSQDHSDHYTPQGINAVNTIRYESVPDNSLYGISNCGPLCGTSHITMSSQIYSVSRLNYCQRSSFAR
jgi:hypothetical protein